MECVEYMKYLAGPYKHLMEEQKKAGDRGLRGVPGVPPQPHEPDIILTVVYKNWAAMDGLRDKVDPIIKRCSDRWTLRAKEQSRPLTSALRGEVVLLAVLRRSRPLRCQ
jgi:hypothetical protein